MTVTRHKYIDLSFTSFFLLGRGILVSRGPFIHPISNSMIILMNYSLYSPQSAVSQCVQCVSMQVSWNRCQCKLPFSAFWSAQLGDIEHTPVIEQALRTSSESETETLYLLNNNSLPPFSLVTTALLYISVNWDILRISQVELLYICTVVYSVFHLA